MSHSADEAYTCYDETYPQARQDHRCDACKETIPAGHHYASVSIIFLGTITRVKRCFRCQRIHKHLRGLGSGDTWPDEQLDCGEAYEDEWGRLPDDVAALAFVTPDEAQR